MAVDQYALTSLAAVKEWMGLDDDDVQANAFAIYHDGNSGAEAVATVAVLEDSLLLVDDGGTTTVDLTNASYDTLGELVTYINTQANWVATLLGPSAGVSTDLIRFPATNCLLAANEQVILYQGNALLEDLIDRISDKIETYCGRKFKSRSYREWLNGKREQTLRLKNYPVTAIVRIGTGSATAFTVQGTTSTDLRATVDVQDDQLVLTRYDSTGTAVPTALAYSTYVTASDLVTQIALTSGWTATLQTNCLSLDLHRNGGQDAKGLTVDVTFPDQSDTGFRVEEDSGLVEINSADWWWGEDFTDWPARRRWPQSWQGILVEYTAGYSTIPDDLEQICIEMVSDAYNARGQDVSVSSESIGSYSYTLAQQVNIDDTTAKRLAQWREVR